MSAVFRRWVSTATNFRPERPEEIKQLLKPIGVASRPLLSQPTASKTLQERKAELMDLERNRIRREELKREFAKSSFHDIYKFRHTGGKIFTAPPQPFGAKESLYMANIFGLQLDSNVNADSSVVHLLASDRPNIVRLFSSALGQQQINAFTSDLDLAQLGVRMIDVNIPTNWVNRMLVRLFARRIRRNEIGKNGALRKYLLANNKLDKDTKDAIGAFNELAGYVYIVDKEGRIRWATSGPPLADEKEKMLALLENLAA